MNNKYEPCSICELYIFGYECHNDKCPVAKMKAEVESLKWERDSTLKLLEAKREEEQREHNSMLKELETIKSAIPDTLSRIKAEAIKEFAERIEPKMANNTDISAIGYQSVIAIIDNLVKEMTEVRHAETD